MFLLSILQKITFGPAEVGKVSTIIVQQLGLPQTLVLGA